MIVKQRTLKLSSGTLFGIGGGAFGLLTVALMIQSSFSENSVPGCEMRYANAGIFALKRSSGELLDTASLQSKLYGDDWGLLDNVSIDGNEGAGNRTSMNVRFQPGGKFDARRRTADSGVGFTWRPRQLTDARSACVSYSVWLPANFEFGDGGVLPSLFGQALPAGKEENFSVRMRWLKNGKLGVQPTTSASERPRHDTVDKDWLTLERGKWINIEQEVRLNDPGAQNGHLRVWVDGKLHMDRRQVTFRESDTTRFEGVTVDVHYADTAMNWQPAPDATEVRVSPLIIRWK